MRVLKIILIIGAVGATLGVGIFVLVFQLTRGAAESADTLFALLAAGDLQGAYDSTAPQFRNEEPFESFAQGVSRLRLDQYVSSDWNSRSISNGQSTLEGTITLLDGSTVPMRVELVDVNDVWMVYGLTTQTAGSNFGGDVPEPPTLDVAERLTQESLGAFADAINRSDFTDFHASTAALWRAEITPEDLQAAFQHIIDRGIDLSGAAALPPAFSADPVVNDNGFLQLRGYMPSNPDLLYFRLRYAYEAPDWRLIGIRIDSEPIPADDG